METEQTEKKSKMGFWGVLLKFGPKLLKLTKFLKFGLAAASFGSWALLYTWKFAILIMISIGWHESGHVWAMKKMGMKTKGFYYLPFLGGAAIPEEHYRTYWQNVFVAIMGPIAGLLLALVSLGLFWFTGTPLFAAAASWMAVLNLLNLFPISPFDGGQVIRAVGFSLSTILGRIFLLLSFAVGAVFTFKAGIGLFAFFVIIGGLDLAVEFFLRKKANIKRPTSLTAKQIAITLASYILTIAILVGVVKVTAHIPGADVAANFLDDK